MRYLLQISTSLSLVYAKWKLEEGEGEGEGEGGRGRGRGRGREGGEEIIFPNVTFPVLPFHIEAKDTIFSII